MNKKSRSHRSQTLINQISLQFRNGERQSCPGGNTADQGEQNHLDS